METPKPSAELSRAYRQLAWWAQRVRKLQELHSRSKPATPGRTSQAKGARNER